MRQKSSQVQKFKNQRSKVLYGRLLSRSRLTRFQKLYGIADQAREGSRGLSNATNATDPDQPLLDKSH